MIPLIVKLGSVGEERLAKLLYLQMTSCVLPRPISLLLKAPSATGKNWTAERVVKLFPSHAYYWRTGLSPKALAYSGEKFSHRIIVVAEASGFQTADGAYFLRSLLSEGRVSHQTVLEGKGETLTVEGPVGLLTASTAINLDEELETRAWTVPVDDSPEQTRRILLAHADMANENAAEPDLSEWLEARGCALRHVKWGSAVLWTMLPNRGEALVMAPPQIAAIGARFGSRPQFVSMTTIPSLR